MAVTNERDRVLAQLETVTGQLETVTNERDTGRTQFDRAQTHNVALLDVINQFRTRVQDFEARGQDDQALRSDLLGMVGCKFCFNFLRLC